MNLRSTQITKLEMSINAVFDSVTLIINLITASRHVRIYQFHCDRSVDRKLDQKKEKQKN